MPSSDHTLPVHGPLHYRTAPEGTVALLPRTCQRGHDLGRVGYQAMETGGVLRLRCHACDETWALRTGPVRAVRAELDDEPYRADNSR